MLLRVTMLAPLTPNPTDSKELIFLMVFSRTLVSYMPTLAERREREGERERGRQGQGERVLLGAPVCMRDGTRRYLGYSESYGGIF